MKQFLIEQMVKGLQRSSLTKESTWAERYRVMTKTFAGKWSFDHHPWLFEMHNDRSEVIVGQKAAQMGFSEWAINKTFFWLDILQQDVLYLLPNSKPDASDFSVGRFEPALQASDHIRNMFSDTKNIGMKKAGSAILYIRGSRSDSQLKSIPTGKIVYDEYDEMPEGTRALAQERMSGQQDRQELLISTPTIPDWGINEEFNGSDRKHFFFRCPRCGQLEELTYSETDAESSLVIIGDRYNDPRVVESHLRCKNTNLVLPHESKIEWLHRKNTQWVKQEHNTSISGYHVNQLYSMAAHPSAFAKARLRADTNPAHAQEFYKSKMGLPFIETGARVTDEELNGATRPYQMVTQWQGRPTFMGVDVGTRLHYEICDYELLQSGTDMSNGTIGRVLRAGHVRDFEELDLLMAAYHVTHCVIDANPERRKAMEFADRHHGRVSICFYVTGLSSSNSITVQEGSVKVDRTTWLDISLSRFRNGTKVIPADIDQEYKPHIKSLVRQYVIAPNGDISSKYVTAGGADHLAHAANYCEIALTISTSMGGTHGIKI